ncbi:hypothetical protein K0M31_010548 [Melipona bicolor]|uniref:Uncharacterized protein n=1 Tax=Melipona bicolor TaxID=60889 RepID=A0AA40FM23_9HYME|nr:hypothetical protein K0M31_010548 [Melipona bicolor]
MALNTNHSALFGCLVTTFYYKLKILRWIESWISTVYGHFISQIGQSFDRLLRNGERKMKGKMKGKTEGEETVTTLSSPWQNFKSVCYLWKTLFRETLSPFERLNEVSQRKSGETPSLLKLYLFLD